MFETAADRLGRRPAAGPGDALGDGPRPARRGAVLGRHQGPDDHPRHRRQVGRAARARAARQGRRGARRRQPRPPAAAPPAPAAREPWRGQVTEALVGLGWSAKQAGDAVERVAASAPADADIAAYLRAGPARAAAVSTPQPEPEPERGFASEMLEARYADGSYEATARVVDAAGSDDDRLVEAALRPKRLSEFPGQPRVRDQLGLVLEAAKRRGSAPDHVLLSGPPGLGKTTLAMIVAAEIEKPIRVTSGPAIQHAGDLAAVLSSLDEGEVLFLDEIHRMSRSAEEMLYLAMEDFRVDVIVGKGPGRHRHPARAAAVHRGGRHHPGRAAAGAAARPVRLHRRTSTTTTPPTSSRSCTARPGCSASRPTRPASPRSPSRSRGTPRIANRLLRRVRDWAQVHGQGHVDHEAAHAALALFDVDDAGPRPARPGRARGAVPPVRRRPGRAVDPRRGRGGGVRHGRDRRRALPRARGLHRAHPAWPGRRRRGPGGTSGCEAPAGFLQQDALPLDGGPDAAAPAPGGSRG